MDWGALGDCDEDLKFWRPWSEKNRIVYTRRSKKKSRISSENNNTAATTCFIADLTSSAPSTSAAPSTPAAKPTSTVTDVFSSTVTAAVGTEVSTVVISEEPSCCDTASLPSAVNGNLHQTTVPGRTCRDGVERESLEKAWDSQQSPCQAEVLQRGSPTVRKGGDSQQSPCQEEVLQRGSPTVRKGGDSLQSSLQEEVLRRRSPEKDVESSGQQMLEEPQERQEEMPSLLEGKSSAKNRVHEGCRSQAAVTQTLKDLPHPNDSEGIAWEKSPPVHSANEPLLMSDDRPPALEEKSPLPVENDQPIERGLAESELLNGNELPNDEELVTGLPRVPEGIAPVIATQMAKPPVISIVDDIVRINLCNGTPKDDIRELRKKLELELDQVRTLFKEVESKESNLVSCNAQISNNNLSFNSNYIGHSNATIGGYSQPQPLPQHSQFEGLDRRVLVRMNSEMGVVKHQEARSAGSVRVNSEMGAARNLESRPYRRQLSIAVIENNDQGIEKEKRTPKANQYYRNSEFLLGKDRLPPENTKRHKSNNGRSQGREGGHTFGFGFDKRRNRLFKSCGSLLQRLMKHKFGWVFNEPVDAKALGLVDYHDIIKHPMDLGTIKTRLAQNWYKSPGQFAEDVRLVFRNAMTYNPKGQDVHVMAEQLLQIFEERWAVIESEYNPYWKYQIYQDGGLHTPSSRKAPPQSHLFADPVPAPIPAFTPSTVRGPAYTPAPTSIPSGAPIASQMRTSDEPDLMATTTVTDPKIQRPHFGRTPVPKKPKAKDPDKRDMTYDEKQRLSTNLQGLPPEKLDAIIQIIKKRNTAVSQHDDEIEVEIDNVDTETLWELDRFVTNYKKSLSKNKRKAELALQARLAVNQNTEMMNSTRPVAEVQIGRRAAIGKEADGEKPTVNRSRSSSSNSSSSDSGSSSSDSDSDSSSADGSDAEHSPRT